ncbi:MAG: FtsW/RodA/SpoVE family cell cycle protein, partial [Planctomycetota bacterium]
MRTSAQALRASLRGTTLLPTFALVLFGLLCLASVGKGGGPLRIDDWHVRQMAAVAIGLMVGTVLLLVPFKKLVANAYFFYALNIGLLLAVLFLAPPKKGAQRWISVAGFDLQPSEYMKIVLVLTLARYIRFRSSYKTFKGLGTPFLLTLLPMALVLKQPDLGTALIFIPILFTMLFVAGARLRHLITIVLLGALAMVPIWKFGLKEYQRDRIHGFVVMAWVLRVGPKLVDRHFFHRERQGGLAAPRTVGVSLAPTTCRFIFH